MVPQILESDNEKKGNLMEEKKSEILDMDQPADFETAISATRFGKFNIILFFIALPSTWASEFDFTSTSYILPAAQCDLELSLVMKGWLNAITYIGTVCSAFLWGYFADTLGRRKLLIYGYFLDAFFVVLSSFSQNFWTLFFIKFLNGFIICGPYAILMSFICEFHGARYRAPILLLSGIFFSLANVTLSALAWLIIPQDISFSLFQGTILVRSWQVFLIVCSVPSFVSGFLYLWLPESPKFLMTAGRNEEAMMVFRRIYSINSGNPSIYYPIKELVIENVQKIPEKLEPYQNEKCSTRSNGGWKQLFSSTYLQRIVHIFTILFMGLLGENTLRLWLPQLFTKIDEFTQLNGSNHTASLCQMLDVSHISIVVNGTMKLLEETCTVIKVDKQVYINTIIVATTNAVGFVIASLLVNKIGKKILLIMMYGMCAIAGIGNYWSTGLSSTLFLASMHGGVASVCTSTMISVIVDLFPTTLRTMTISLGMMFGRLGSIFGNVMFPVLLEIGCLPPFLLIGGTALGCTLLSLFLPNLKMKSLD